MTSPECHNCVKLRDAFEGREAVYIEKGVYRVRVVNIRYSVERRWVKADGEELPTPGLLPTSFHSRRRNESGPLRWSIGGGYLTDFSEHTWHMGYGGWSLFFAPEIVIGLVKLAFAWPAELDERAQYKQVLDFLLDQHAYEPTTRVFPG